MNRSSKRIAASVAAVVVAGGTVTRLVVPWAYAAGINGGAAQVVTPAAAGNTPLSSGGSATPFSLKLPAGAACKGDSANGNYRIQSYMVPASVDPSTLSFDNTGPTSPGFSEPLYDLGGSPYINVQTANADTAGGPGLIVNIPAFSYFVYEPPPGFAIPPGVYNIGIACTLGQPGPNQLEKFFNVQKTFTANPADRPAQVTWVVGAVTPPTTVPPTTVPPTTVPPTTVPPTTVPPTTVPPTTVPPTTVPPTTVPPTTVPPTTVPPTTVPPTTVPPTTSTSTTTPPPTTIPPNPEGGSKYTMVAKDGGVFAPGGEGFYGTARVRPGDGLLRDSQGRIIGASGTPLDSPVVAFSYTPTRRGYWLAQADGGVIPIGDALDVGDLLGSTHAPIVDAAATEDGAGLYLVASDGGVFALGTAPFMGSLGGTPLTKPIVGMALDSDGSGYYLVASDGGVFAYDAPFLGSLGSTTLAKPIVGVAVGVNGGYVLVASDGGAFTYGYGFSGSLGGVSLEAPIVGIAADPDGSGYWMAGADGGVFAFDADFSGSVSSILLNAPISGIAAL